MFQNDLVGVASVYIYVVILLILTEKILIKKPETSRKVLHIMVGNVAFLLPIFVTREVMAFIAAGPFIFLTFLMSPHSPVKSIKGKTSSAGHGMGLVYYSITWTIFAYIFFDNLVLIAIGIFAMSYGDGFASLIGMKYGKHKYNILGDEKSYIGSISMFLFTFIMMIVAIFYYNFINSNITINYMLFVFLALFAAVGAFIEGITPKGLDNLTVPFVIAILYCFVFIIWGNLCDL